MPGEDRSSTADGTDDRHQDPMAADKRVLIIGLVAMVILVGIGVVSASLFATSACRDIGPDPVEGTVAGQLGEVLDAVAGQDGDLTDALTGIADDLGDAFGPLTGAAVVSGASGVRAFAGGVAATGPLTVALDVTGAEVVAAASFDDPTRLVGSGEHLYSIALMNPLTGQVDALIPLDGELTPGPCLDTAVVGDPFAFHLDAGGGELLLLRLEEDADDPELELRDAEAGRRWMTGIEAPVAPPGILAERITAVLADDIVVAARRIIPGESEPAIVGVDRSTGEQRWQVEPQVVLDLVGIDEPTWLDVLAVRDGLAVVAAAGESDRDRASLVVVALEDGGPAGVIEPGGGRAEVLGAHVGDDAVWVARLEDGVVVESYDPSRGQTLASVRVEGASVAFADGAMATPSSVLVFSGADDVVEVARGSDQLRFLDVVRFGEVTSVLVEADDDAVLLTFGGRG